MKIFVEKLVTFDAYTKYSSDYYDTDNYRDRITVISNITVKFSILLNKYIDEIIYDLTKRTNNIKEEYNYYASLRTDITNIKISEDNIFINFNMEFIMYDDNDDTFGSISPEDTSKELFIKNLSQAYLYVLQHMNTDNLFSKIIKD